jgi:Cu(I)/Ag(I) efflux system membrane fusion protein
MSRSMRATLWILPCVIGLMQACQPHGATTPAPAPRAAAAPGAAGAGAAGPASAVEPASSPESAVAPRYRCAMHPWVVSDRPGRCPICRMELIPIEEEGTAPGAGRASAAGLPPGQSAVWIPPRKQQLLGVRTVAAALSPLTRTVRATARVAVDETRLYHVHARVEGWVEKVAAGAEGDWVRRGSPLLTLYSPDLLATQEEYLLALRARDRAGATALPEVAAGAGDMLASARRRLELSGLEPGQIDDLERTGHAPQVVTLHAPASGYIVTRGVKDGMKIDPSVTLFDLADLSHVWVIASVYENELPFVRAGQEAVMTLSYLPGSEYHGRVTLVSPYLDPATRTVQVRMEFPNPRLELKPEMYADVALRADLGERLQVPASAVLSSGTRDLVFVAGGDGYFEPRAIRVGVRLENTVEVLEGLRAGDTVVAAAAFMVDSESRLQAALEAAAGGAPPPGAHTHTEPH